MVSLNESIYGWALKFCVAKFGPVSACRDYLCPFVEHGWWVCCRYHHFLTQADVTASGAASVGCRFLDQFPLDVLLQVLRLQVPHILRQFSGFSSLFCTERMHVCVVVRFEIAFCEAEVVACWLKVAAVTVAWYTMHSARQFPSSGHCCLFLLNHMTMRFRAYCMMHLTGRPNRKGLEVQGHMV